MNPNSILNLSMIKPLVKPQLKCSCVGKIYAVRFDGVSSYGYFESKIINPDGDIENISFWSPDSIGSNQTIISQNISSNIANQEFQIYVTSNYTLGICRGGSALLLINSSEGFVPNQLYSVRHIGNTVQVIKDNVPLKTLNFVKGAAREPLAITRIGVRSNNQGSLTNYFKGLMPGIGINDKYWPMSHRNALTQASSPAGSNMNLLNVSPAHWEQIPCKIRR